MESLKPKILCVDDEPGVLEALSRLLKGDFEVLTANSAQSGRMLVAEHPDMAVVLSDFRMPNESGIDFLKSIRNSHPETVRAILSGQMDTQQLMDAINRVEIHRFILKPWENEYLKLQLLEALQAHQTLKESGRLRHLAITDPVTGLTNHRYMQERLRVEVAAAQQNSKPFSLIMIDVDHFKSYNDRYGHPEGDRLLADIADLLTHFIRPIGSASRYGGEEFVLQLPGFDLTQAQAQAEKLRAKIEQHAFRGPKGRRAYVTVSIGVASFPQNGATPAQLIEAADRALYQAKRQGRNQIAAASGME